MELAKEIWQKHVDVFDSFDLVSNNGNSLQEETMTNGLFNAIVTLEHMRDFSYLGNKERVEKAIEYLKGSKYYSEANNQSDY